MAVSALAAGTDPRSVRKPPRASLSWTIALGGLAAAAISCTLALTSGGVTPELGAPLVLAMLAVWVTLSYVVCGVVAWRRRPGSRFGPLMIAAGFANFLSTLVWATAAVPYTIGQAADLLPPVLFLTVFLAFPEGRLRGSFVRSLVATAFVVAIGLELLRMASGGFGPHNLLEIYSDPNVAEVVRKVQLTTVSVLCLAGVAVLITRRFRDGRPLRRSLALVVDAFGLTLVMVAFLFVSAAFGGPWLAQIRWATFVVLGIAPIVFLTGLLHARLARSALGDLIVELHADLAPVDLRDALARTLRDPSLDLAYWLPDFATYADVDGQRVDIIGLGRGRAMTLIERNGERVGALLHDAWLQDEPELLGAATAAAGIALENGRLQAELRARVNELRASRARIVGAGDEERRRLERNLHDGAQQRLVALGMQLRLLESRIRTDPAAAEALVATAASELAISVDELRELARGIHPAVLDHGLTVALESLAARSTVATAVSVDLLDRLPEVVEVAAYFVASEALANVAKYAQATTVTINVSRTAGAALVEVADDGVGGADDEAGSGLRGLADRVEALGGQLRISSPRGSGTTISAVIPCES